MPSAKVVQVPNAKHEIGMLIERAMIAKGLTPDTLGPKVGVSGSSIRAYIAGRHSPKMDTMTKICLVLGIAGDSIIAAAGMPLVPHEASEIQGVIKDLLLIRQRDSVNYVGIAGLAESVANHLRGQ